MIFMGNTIKIIRLFLFGLFFLTLAFPFNSFAGKTGVAGDLERSSSTTPQEKVKYAADSNSEMRDAVKTVLKMLEGARRESNVEELQCLSNRLTSIRALAQVSEATEITMKESLAKGQQERAAYEFRKIAVALTKTRRLLAEANRCVDNQSNTCAINPCKNGGTCTSNATGYTCGCLPGWKGANCDVEDSNDFDIDTDIEPEFSPPAPADPTPVVSITTKDGKKQEVKEDSGSSLNFTVSLSSAASKDLSIPYTVTGVDANDLNEGLTGTLAFAKGDKTKDLALTVKNDNVVEEDETFTIILGKMPTGVTLDDKKKTVTGTILNDDNLIVSIATRGGDKQSVTEDPGSPLSFTVSLSQAAPKNLTIPYSVTGVDADDLNETLTGTLEIAKHNWSKELVFTVNDDQLIEKDEIFTVTLGDPPDGMTLGDKKSATGTIKNDDDYTLSVEPKVLSQKEGDQGETTQYEYTVKLNVPAIDDLSMFIRVIDPSIIAGVSGDLVSIDSDGYGTLNFKQGDAEKKVIVEIKGDTVVEDNENFTIFLYIDSSLLLGDQIRTSATGTILNDDKLPVLAIAAAEVKQTEGNGSKKDIDFEVTLSAKTPKALQVLYTITGSGANPADSDDFSQSLKGEMTIDAGSDKGTLSIEVKGDTTAEKDETFTVTLSATEGATLGENNAVTGTILNDDNSAPVVKKKIPDQEITAGEKLSIDVYGAFSDADGDVLTITGEGLPEGAVLRGIQLTKKFFMTRDWLSDIGEHIITITADDKKGGKVSTTFKLTVKEIIPEVSITAKDADKKEGHSDDSSFTFTVKLDKAAKTDTTVSYSVTGTGTLDGKDFKGGKLPSGKATILKGQTSKDIAISVEGDTDVEEDETFTVTLGAAPVGVTLGEKKSATGIIKNDDSKPIVSNEATTCAALTPYKCLDNSCVVDKQSCPTKKTTTGTNTGSASLGNKASSKTTTTAKIVKKVVSISQKDKKTGIKEGTNETITYTVTLSCPEDKPFECSASTCAVNKDNCTCPAGYQGTTCGAAIAPSGGSISASPVVVTSEKSIAVSAMNWKSATGGKLTYAWSATCGLGLLGSGVFKIKDDNREAEWKAPINFTRSGQACSLSVEVKDTGNGATTEASRVVTLLPDDTRNLAPED